MLSLAVLSLLLCRALVRLAALQLTCHILTCIPYRPVNLVENVRLGCQYVRVGLGGLQTTEG